MPDTKRSSVGTSPIFIGGLMKSGTSLMRVLLGQHPDLYATFETHWFSEAVRLHWHDPTSQRMRYLRRFLDLNENEYERLCRIKRAEPEREFIDIAMAYCAERAGKRRWVEKTPDNIRYWSLIQEHWPDAFMIHMIREYKDTFASWKERRKDSLDQFLATVRQTYDDVRPILGRETERYLEVDYHDLVTETEKTMRRVLAKIGVSWDDACARINLENTRSERDKFQKVLNRDSPTLVSLTRPIFTDSLEQWRRILSAEEAARIEEDFAEYYDVFGFRLDGL